MDQTRRQTWTTQLANRKPNGIRQWIRTEVRDWARTVHDEILGPRHGWMSW